MNASPGMSQVDGRQGPLGLNPNDFSLPLPQNRDELTKLYSRWQELKSMLGDSATTNPEFIEISRVLRAFSRHQEQVKQQKLRQGMGNGFQNGTPQQSPTLGATTSQASTPMDSSFQSDSRTPSFSGAGPGAGPGPATGAGPGPGLSPAVGGGPGPGSASAIPGAAAGPFNHDQLLALRNQMLAFRALSKNQPVPPNVASVLFNSSPQISQSGSAQSPYTNQIRTFAGRVGRSSPQAAGTPQPGQQHASPSSARRQQSRTPSVSSPGISSALVRPSATPPPATISQKLGVDGTVDPFSYISESIPFDTFGARQKQLLIPSIMPVGIDLVAMKQAREKDIVDQMNARIIHLQSEKNPDTEMLIELKSLQLLNYRSALRGDMVALSTHFHSSGVTEMNRSQFVRLRRPYIQEALITERFDMEQRQNRMVRENQKKLDFLNTMCRHAHDVLLVGKNKRTKMTKVGRAVIGFHQFIEKEEQKRAERTAKQRLQALRANDEEAYIKLLDQTKDTRITHLLKQTNSFLDSLAESVKRQQQETRAVAMAEGVANGEDMPMVEDDDDEDAGEKVDYYAVAHRIREDIKKQPSILVGGTLKEYQMKGLQWMVSLYNNNLNGILADEMGLGKTIQSISLITYLIEAKQHPGPYLVIVPLSTLTNWTLEFEKWAPSVKKVVYKGTPQARKALQGLVRMGDFQVLLTTYEYIIKDRPVLSRIRWVHMIIDEGHRMKNASSKLSSTLTQYYTSKYRLILTGTPLQNNLPELWALLNFVLPKIFNSVKSFDEWFNTPFANTGGQDKMDLSEEETLLIIRRLHKVLRPFLLRRLKKDVEKDLPDKVEKVIKCKMSALQYKLYQQMLKHKVIFTGEGTPGSGSSSGLKGLNNQIMQLRKICNHPYVFEEVEDLVNPQRQTNDDLWRVAGKFELLDRILPKFKSTGHRVLLFFQMTQIMDIMEDFLRLRGMQYLRLDGATKAEDRSELLKVFNAPDSPYFAFLLSTRAGGLGLNLQTADTVIIYDTDWNPHQDLQAQDRAHRIGQTKEVRILRLITEASVEENILERAHRKLDIDGKVIQAGKFDNKSTSEEQEAFLRSLLEADDAKREQKEEEDDDEDMDDDELNEVLARDDSERTLFKQMDRERAQNEAHRKRLMTDDELPEIYRRDTAEFMKPEPIENYGRGTRERKIIHYDDGLTEDQWLEAMDNEEDSVEDAVARKRARMKRRKKRDGINGTPSPSDSATPSTPAGLSGVGLGTPPTRKRKRKGKIDSETSSVGTAPSVVEEAPKSKRAKGRPPKIKETLSPEERKVLNEKLQVLYDCLLEIEDENGRTRVDLFLELPPKKVYPDYYVLIQNPIACDVISKRIATNYYQSLTQLLKDYKQMFDNARVYNEEGSLVYEDANELEKVLRAKVKEVKGPADLVPDEDEDEDEDEELPEPIAGGPLAEPLESMAESVPESIAEPLPERLEEPSEPIEENLDDGQDFREEGFDLNDTNDLVLHGEEGFDDPFGANYDDPNAQVLEF